MNVLDYVDYDPEAGILSWSQNFRHGNFSRCVGEPVNTHKLFSGGETEDKAYLRFCFGGKLHLVHVVAWKKLNGKDVPKGFFVDHINRDRMDNRACNLRLANNFENTHNAGTRKDNRLGVKGVRKLPSGRYWVRVRHLNVRYNLGTFDTIEEAVQAANAFREKHHGEFASDGNNYVG